MATARRILLVTYEYPPVGGGMGKAARNITRTLAGHGHDVAVLTSRFGNQPAMEREQGVLVLRIPVLRRHINFASAYEVLSFAASGLLRTGWITRRFRPDLVLAFLTIPSGIVAEGISRLTGAPWICYLRGQDVPGYPDTPRWMHRLAWPVTWYLWKRAARVFANSAGLAGLAHQSSPALAINIVPNGIDVERYRPHSGKRGRVKTVVLFTGRLVRFKRLRQLIEAWAEVADTASGPVELWLAGYGPERSILRHRARELGIVESVRFLGRLEEDRLIRALQCADIFVSPSEGEGLPNAVLEAMACGLPVVLSDIGPHRELLVDEKGGVLCGEGTPDEIAGALLDLVEDRELRQRLGCEAREVVRERFSWDMAVRELETHFPPFR